jgi:hypothetical protein
MHDAVQFELSGKPAVAVIEDLFEPLAEAKKDLMGLKDFQPTIVEHPIGSSEEAAAKGRAIAVEVAKRITGSG